ncbi:MAG: MlaD family protein [Candidatus Dormibacteria bacterium]
MSRRGWAGLGLVLTLILAGVTGVAYAGSRPYTVKGYFLSAEGITTQNDVVLQGVPIGSVTAVELAPDDAAGGAGAIITMQLDEHFAPLLSGTRATIRPKGLLGTMFVELSPGPSGSPEIPSGGTIPIEDTASPVDVDQVTNIFDKTTRDKVQTLTREGGAALAGRGPDVNNLLSQLPPISRQASDITATLAGDQVQLDAMTREFDTITQQVAGEDAALRRDFTNGASLLDTVAARQQHLEDELTSAQQTLTDLNGGLSGHEQDLNHVFKSLPGLISELQTFSTTSTPVLAELNPCMNDVIQTITELRGADAYHNVGPAQDASGYSLRVYTVFTGSTGSPTPPVDPCGKSKP